MIAFASAPILAFSLGDKIAVDGGVAIVWPAGSNTVLSVQPDGSYQTRSRSAIGSWETARDLGDKLVYVPDGHVYVVPLVTL